MRSRSTILAVVTGCAAILIAAAPVLAALDTVSGHAWGESVDVTLLNTVHVTSGPTPYTGELASNGSNSPLGGSLASVCVATACSVLSTGILTVHTEGSTGPTGTVKSTASVATVNALNGILTATLVYSECDIDSNGGATIIAKWLARYSTPASYSCGLHRSFSNPRVPETIRITKSRHNAP